MSNKNDIYQDFLEKFIEEILLIFKIRQEEEKRKRREEQIRLANIESEKLKMKLFRPEIRTIEKNPVISPTNVNVLIQQPSIRNQNREINSAKHITQKEQPRMIQEMTVAPQIMRSQQLPLKGIENEYGIDFGRLIYFVLNPHVTYIDCAGPNKEITIKAGNIFKADITLNKEEIEMIIKSFSEKARIPLIEGMLKARIKDLEMAAIVSLAGSSFILKKYIGEKVLENTRVEMHRPIAPKNPINQRVLMNKSLNQGRGVSPNPPASFN